MALLLLLNLLVNQDSVEVVPSTIAWGVDTCLRSVYVRDPHLFRPGTRVLMHVPACLPGPGEVHDDLGAWSWNVIDTITGSRLWMRYRIASAMVGRRRLQIVRAVEPSAGRLDHRIGAQSWNGSNGGVIAIWSDTSLHVTGQLSASGSGFSPGARPWNTRDTTPNDVSGNEVQQRNGSGQGACPRSYDPQFEHPWFAGGRGGLPRNGGGSGGNGAGAGGAGGTTSTAFGPAENAISGAARPPHDAARLVFGTAGGHGHGNDLDGGLGGAGGGIVMIRCRSLYLHPGSFISADGVNGKDASHDGAGGGGGGGMIIIDADTINGSGSISARGGHGGSTHSTLFLSGPGGGGAGGSISTRTPLPPTIRASTDPGAAGAARTSTQPQRVTDHGARPGEHGRITATGERWYDKATRVPRARISCADSVVETGTTTTLWMKHGASVAWLDDVTVLTSDSARTPTITKGRWFRALITTSDGCVTIDSVHVRPKPTKPTLIVSIGDLRARAGDSVDIYLSVRATASAGRTIEGTAYVSTHPNVLLPMRSGGKIAMGRTRLVLPFRLSSTGSSTYRRDRLIAVLGDSASVQLSIDSVILTASSPTLAIHREHGTFSLDDVCLQGGRARLFESGAAFAIAGRTIRSDAEEIYVCDVLGRILQHLRNPTGSEQHHTIASEIHGLVFIVVGNRERIHSVPIWLSATGGH